MRFTHTRRFARNYVPSAFYWISLHSQQKARGILMLKVSPLINFPSAKCSLFIYWFPLQNFSWLYTFFISLRAVCYAIYSYANDKTLNEILSHLKPCVAWAALPFLASGLSLHWRKFAIFHGIVTTVCKNKVFNIQKNYISIRFSD